LLRSSDGIGSVEPVTQLFTRTTAVLNLVVWHATLIGTVVGPQWLSFTGWIGVLIVTVWTAYAAWRAGLDPFPDLRDRAEGRNREVLPEPGP
jgi:hypothetical protein